MTPSTGPFKERLVRVIIVLAAALIFVTPLPAAAQSDRVTDFPGVSQGKPKPTVGPPKVVEVRDLTVDGVIDERNMVLSGAHYKFSGSTEFLGISGKRIGFMSLRRGDVVDIVYYTNRPRTETQVFSPTDKVLTKVRVITKRK